MKGGHVSNVLRNGGTGAVKCNRERSVEAAAILLTFIGISRWLIEFVDQGRFRRYRSSL
jgi:hypothetical protein